MDKPSETCIIHGHELDYNKIDLVKGERVSCIDGLTRAINNYLTQNDHVEVRVREATNQQKFSYWYGFAGLPEYIKAVNLLFGADDRVYEREVAKVARSKEVGLWLDQQESFLTHTIGRVGKTLAHSPHTLLEFYGFFYRILGKIVERKVRSILSQTSYPDVPRYCFGNPIQHLVLGHFHRSETKNYPEGSSINISSPRVHVNRMVGNRVQLHRDYSYVTIDGANL